MDEIRILYAEKGIIVCVKPAGVLSQEGNPGQESMVSLLRAQTGGEIYPVHRLDRETGGVMVYAGTPKTAADLSRDIQERRIVKEYLAVLTGMPGKPSDCLQDLLFHDRNRNKTFVTDRKRKGVKEAALIYRVLDTRDRLALVQVRLLTGRTHQIRAQFASRGLPLLGDSRYGGGRGVPALCLWSAALTLELQGTSRRFLCLPPALGPFRCPDRLDPLIPENMDEAQKKC